MIDNQINKFLNTENKKFSKNNEKMKKVFLSINNNLLFVCLFIASIINFPRTKSEFIEPLNIFLERQLLLKENLKNFSSNMDILMKTNSNNQTFIPLGFVDRFDKKCIATKYIKANDEILSFELENTINLFDEFPFKKIFLNLINDATYLNSNNKNMTNFLLLSLRLMFDLKADFRNTFILLKNYDQEQFQIMKNYLIKRTKFIHKYVQLLPLSDYYGQMSWSLEDIEEYKVSGILPTIRDKISKIYKELVNDIKADGDKFYFYNVTKDWLNENNLNYFMSLYGYTLSKSFKFDLSSLSELKSKYNKNNINSANFENDLNILIQKNGGGLILIPFLDQCRHYQPGLKSNQNNDIISLGKKEIEKFQLKKISINYNSENDRISINSNSEIFANEEFLFSFTDFLTNDNLLLNYGIVIRNNLFQEFLFKFEMEDPGYKFYQMLKASNFDMTLLNISDEYKLNIQFSLKRDSFSKVLFDFISVYNKNYINEDRDSLSSKDSKIKNNKKVKNSDLQMDINIRLLLKSLILYESTINKNIFSMLDSLKEEKSENKESYQKDHKFFYEKIIEEKNKILKINKIIYENVAAINKEKNSTELLHDDVQNLFYYKALHDNKKSLLIKIFNFENLKILFSHKNIINKEIVSLLNNNIKSLKRKYIK